MSSFRRKLVSQKQAPQSTRDESELERFYTDSEHALKVFDQLVTSVTLPKRILAIHGLGGVGKSTLLKMYTLTCLRQQIPAALVASEEAPSAVDVLAKWEADLNQDGITLPTFQKTLNHYRAIRAKVEAEWEKGQQAASQLAGTIGKTVAKTAITMAASVIPGIGPLVGAVGSESAEAFIDWLRSFLIKPDIDLYLDASRRLDGDFLNDLSRVVARRRIVLMIDTYEHMTTLDGWMRELVRKLPKNVLLVIAGRKVPDWDRAWQDWMGKAELVELKEMTPDDIRTLVHRYYAYIRSGKPDQQQVEAIVQFARGLPMVATTVVQLWVKHGSQDFQTVRPQVVADLVDRLLEGVPVDTRPAFESAAVLRYFNVESLSALLDQENAEQLYAELRRWPFIRSRKEGLAVHDIMREMIGEALSTRAPQRFHLLHERAAKYYETQLEEGTSDERERSSRERLYHRVSADEVRGMQLFQQIAEELTRYRMLNQLRAVLNDVCTYPLKRENSRLWRDYYNARLAHLEAQIRQAEAVYQAIAENEQIETKLRAYALCDWGGILCRRERLRQPGVQEKAIHLLELSHQGAGAIDVKLAMCWIYLSDIFMAMSDWGKALFHLAQARRFFTERHDYSGILSVLDTERAIYWRRGDLRKTFGIEKEMQDIYREAGEPSYLRIRLSPRWIRLWAGRYSEREVDYRAALEVARELQDQEYRCRNMRDLGLCLGLQDKCAEALTAVEEGLSLARDLAKEGTIEVFSALTLAGITSFRCGDLDKAEKYLTEAMEAGDQLHAHLDTVPLYLGMLSEVLHEFDKAGYFYQCSQAEALQIERNLFECGALAGLVRVMHARNDYATIPSLWAKAQGLAQRFEYNDHLSSLNLSRGHITWDGHVPEWESGFEAALHYYQLSLIHALRFNRFLLDEALTGRDQGTPLRPIVQHCLKRGEEGQRMLLALRDWWQSEMNDIGTPRPDTISPIPEGISLLAAEHLARQREPGDGWSQINVVEQITMALQ